MVRHITLSLSVVVLLCGIALGTGITYFGVPYMKNSTMLKLKEPLLLNAEGEIRNYHMLPAGTVLYLDHSFPEGHDRYRVYINFKGAFEHEIIESDKPNFISPIWAYNIQKADISKLISDTPVSKDDLIRILKARNMTRDDLADIVRNWKD